MHCTAVCLIGAWVLAAVPLLALLAHAHRGWAACEELAKDKANDDKGRRKMQPWHERGSSSPLRCSPLQKEHSRREMRATLEDFARLWAERPGASTNGRNMFGGSFLCVNRILTLRGF